MPAPRLIQALAALGMAGVEGLSKQFESVDTSRLAVQIALRDLELLPLSLPPRPPYIVWGLGLFLAFLVGQICDFS